MRVLVADDHPIIRAALTAMLTRIEPEVEVVEAESFMTLERHLAESALWDLVLLDLRMPGYVGRNQIAGIVKAAAPKPVAIFSMSEDAEEMRALVSLGVQGFIPKTTDHAVLEGILRVVLAGGLYVPAGLALDAFGRRAEAGGLVSGPAQPAEEPPATGAEAAVAAMTPRQRQVMDLLADGLSNSDICARLGLNLSTVKAHVSAVLRALGAGSRTQAALRARALRTTPSSRGEPRGR